MKKTIIIAVLLASTPAHADDSWQDFTQRQQMYQMQMEAGEDVFRAQSEQWGHDQQMQSDMQQKLDAQQREINELKGLPDYPRHIHHQLSAEEIMKRKQDAQFLKEIYEARPPYPH